ncbi:hypothetical protein ACSSS7_000463 [Eimeria intestinalis]
MLAPWILVTLAAFGDHVVEAAVDAAIPADVTVETSLGDELDGQVPEPLAPDARRTYSTLIPVLLMLAVTASLAAAYAVSRYRAQLKKGAEETESSDASEASRLGTTQKRF